MSKKFTVLLLITILGVSSMPFSAFANNGNGKALGKREKREPRAERQIDRNDRDDDDDNDDDDDDDNDNDEKLEKKIEKLERKANKEQLKSCRKAFKNLFKRGNIGSDTANFYIECLAKVGFNATFTGTTTPPSTPDTTAPIISSVSVTPATTTALITWQTNEASDSTIFWSTQSGFSTSTASSTTNSSKVTSHSIAIDGLQASTTYYGIVRSRDNSSNTSTSSEFSFKTLGAPPVIDTTAPVVTNIATSTATTTIQVTWNTNENATSRLYYSTSSGIDVNASTTSFIENLTLKVSHLLFLSNLLPQTLYYLAIRVIDQSGNATTTPVFTASTTSSI